jgi:myo-inositol-1(or 4)-monophosphatase
MAAAYILDTQADALGAKHDRDFFAQRLAHELYCGGTRIHRLGRQIPAPGTQSAREARSRKRIVQCINHGCRAKHIGRTRSTGVGVRVWEPARLHEHEPVQTHRFHRTSRRADIARMAGLAKHDTNAAEHRRITHAPLSREDRLRLLEFALTPPRDRRPSMHPMLNIAVKAARRAGNIINRATHNLDVLTVRTKSANDFVSEVDHEAERAIVDALKNAYPDHAILAEESGAVGHSEYVWIVDPLDGTTNFLHGFPQYAVSIALMHRNVLSQAVIYDPAHNDLFTASRGRGAFLNDHRLRVSRRTRLAESLIGTGFPFREFVHIDAYLAILRELTQKTAGVRRPGAASLDLAYVAAGRLDGFWEFGLSPWDMAAGALMIIEAGGLVGDLQGNDRYMDSGHIIAGNPKVFAQLVLAVAPHLPPALRTVEHPARAPSKRI